jgi:hypothetical protein
MTQMVSAERAAALRNKCLNLTKTCRLGSGSTSVDSWTDDLGSVVRYALTTRATVICPFHDDVTIRVGDDAAETHAYIRATKVIKAMVQHGNMKLCTKKLTASSTKQQTGSALSVQRSSIEQTAA